MVAPTGIFRISKEKMLIAQYYRLHEWGFERFGKRLSHQYVKEYSGAGGGGTI